MESRDFIYWLQGFFELTDAQELNEKQTDLVYRHLQLVFKHEIEPSNKEETKMPKAHFINGDGKVRC